MATKTRPELAYGNEARAMCPSILTLVGQLIRERFPNRAELKACITQITVEWRETSQLAAIWVARVHLEDDIPAYYLADICHVLCRFGVYEGPTIEVDGHYLTVGDGDDMTGVYLRNHCIEIWVRELIGLEEFIEL